MDHRISVKAPRRRSRPEKRKFGFSGALLSTATGRPPVPLSHNAGQFWPRRRPRQEAGHDSAVVIGRNHFAPSARNPRQLTDESNGGAVDPGLGQKSLRI